MLDLLERRIQWIPARKVESVPEPPLILTKSSKATPIPTSSDGFSFPSKPLFPYGTIEQYLSFKTPIRPSCGFRNVGNTCFLNATIQAIINLPPVYHYLKHHHQNCSKNGFCSACALRKVSETAFSSSHPIIPNPLVGSISALRKSFRVGRQEDAHEFFISLMSHIQDGFTGGPKAERKLPPRVPCTTAIHQIFGCFLASNVKCKAQNCTYSSRIFEPVLGISLEINKRVKSLKDALDLFMHKEVVEGYKCEQCKKPVPVDKWFSIRTTPNVLVVHFKRFSFTGRGSKLSQKIPLPSLINLRPYTCDAVADDDCVYSLSSVIVHHGSSLSFGHYTSFVKSSNGLWYHYDDESVSSISEQKMLSRGDGYVALFVKQKSILVEKHDEDEEEAVEHPQSISTPPLEATPAPMEPAPLPSPPLFITEEVSDSFIPVEGVMVCGRRRMMDGARFFKRVRKEEDSLIDTPIMESKSLEPLVESINPRSATSNDDVAVLKFDPSKPNKILISKKKKSNVNSNVLKSVDTISGWDGEESVGELMRSEEVKQVKEQYWIDDHDRAMDRPKKSKKGKKKAKQEQKDLTAALDGK
ncbi:hypothetical protein RCL1_004332 [Eukaryota sp. TZLM3-RCL]